MGGQAWDVLEDYPWDKSSRKHAILDSAAQGASATKKGAGCDSTTQGASTATKKGVGCASTPKTEGAVCKSKEALCTSKDAAPVTPDSSTHVARGYDATVTCRESGQSQLGAQGKDGVGGASSCKWIKEAKTVLNKLKNNQKAWPFLEPVHPVQDECLDYFQCIDRPRDLGSISTNLAASHYANAQAFLFDMLLTFDNAQVYNPPENQIHKLAKEIGAVLATACSSSPYLKSPLVLATEELKLSKEAASSRKSHDAHHHDPHGAPNEALHKELEAAREAMNTPQFKAVEQAVAQLVAGPARTSMSKMTQAALDKVSRHQSGKLLKIDSVLSHKDLVALVQVLKTNCSTQRLDMDGCGIGDAGCEVLRDLLVVNKRIHWLDLQWNQISDAGAALLAEAGGESGLSDVHVGNNTITLPGARALVQAAHLQHTLCGRRLKISGLSDSLLTTVRQDPTPLPAPLSAPSDAPEQPHVAVAAKTSAATVEKSPLASNPKNSWLESANVASQGSSSTDPMHID